jgi:hypothetical protein
MIIFDGETEINGKLGNVFGSIANDLLMRILTRDREIVGNPQKNNQKLLAARE